MYGKNNKEDTMKRCYNCDTILEDDELFCHECGAKQEIEDVEVKLEEQSVEEKFCVHCGKAIEPDSLFCPYCGKPQEEEETKSGEPQPKAEETEPDLEKPQKEKPNVKEELKAEESPKEEPKAEGEPVYNKEEKKKSKSWIWILLVLLIVGIGGSGWYFFSKRSSSTEIMSDSENENVKADLEKKIEDATAFVKEFYSHFQDETYLYNHLTRSALNRLRRDYPYNCEEGDCLATWVFLALPHGVDMELEEGPVIPRHLLCFDVAFKYSYMLDGQKQYEDRSIRLYVIKEDGIYKIFSYNYNGDTKAPRHDEDKVINEIPEGKYNLSLADMHMFIEVRDSMVKGYYYFQAGSSSGGGAHFSGKADNGLKLHLNQWDAGGKDLGYIDGTFDGKTFKGEYDTENGYRRNFEIYVGGE